MLKLEHIMAAINKKLIDKFGLEVNENDIQEGFNRPSFFVKFDNLYKSDYLYTFERSLTVRIHYFPSDRNRYQLEVLDKQQEIENLFYMGFDVMDRNVKTNDIQSDVIDGVLMVSFDMTYIDSSYQEPVHEKMQELSVDV